MFARLTVALTLTALTSWSTAIAQAQTPSISVTAVGEVKVLPDTVVLSGQISETSAKMKDAVTAFNDTRRRTMEAIKGVQIANLSIEASALSISLANGMGGFDDFGNDDEEAEPTPEGALTLSQTVTLTVSGLSGMEEQAVIDLVVSLIGAAQEAGVDLSASSQEQMMMMQFGMDMPAGTTAIFKIGNPEEVRKQATKAAMDKARADAQFLAELAGGKLGRVVAISDLGNGGDEQEMNPYAMIWGMMSEEEIDNGSASYEPVPVVRGLSVQFELIFE